MNKTMVLILAMTPSILLAAESSLPDISVGIEEAINTNFQEKNNNKDGSTFVHGLSLGTSFSGEPSAGLNVTYAPSLKGKYSPKGSGDASEFAFKNGLTFAGNLNDDNAFSTTLSADFINEFDFNDNEESVKNRLWTFSVAPTWTVTINESFSLVSSAALGFSDYLSSTSAVQPDEADKLYWSVGITPIFQVNESVTVKVGAAHKRNLMRTRKSLLVNGSTGGKLAEQTDYTTGSFAVEMKSKEGFSLAPSLTYRTNKDAEFGAKDYTGIIASVSFGYSNDDFSYSGSLVNATTDYKTRLVDPESSTSEIRDYRSFSLGNALTFKKLILSKVDFVVGYDYVQVDSNVTSSDFSNQVFKVGLNFTL